MKIEEVLKAVIDIANKNPNNPRKIYFSWIEKIDIEKNVSFEIKLGCSENNSLIFKEYLLEGQDAETCKERLCYNVINQIFQNIYKRIDTDTFVDNGWSEIVRVNK
jgi:hypothetical protein